MKFDEVLKQRAHKIEQALDFYLPPAHQYPPIIHQAMRYSVFAGGKRLRPILTMASAEAVGGVADTVLPAACAIELIHTYSLIHDDLPAMDNDIMRRGIPTCHIKFNEATAILAGDALLTLAFGLLTRSARDKLVPAEKTLQVLQELADAAGTAGLIGGQVADMLAAELPPEKQDLDYIHTHKTGALFQVAVRAGAILSGADAAQTNALTVYAKQLGLAFQIIDDILDIEGDEQKLGKPVGSDAKNQKTTYPALYGMATAKEKASQAGERALEALTPLGSRAEFLRQLITFILQRQH